MGSSGPAAAAAAALDAAAELLLDDDDDDVALLWLLTVFLSSVTCGTGHLGARGARCGGDRLRDLRGAIGGAISSSGSCEGGIDDAGGLGNTGDDRGTDSGLGGTGGSNSLGIMCGCCGSGNRGFGCGGGCGGASGGDGGSGMA